MSESLHSSEELPEVTLGEPLQGLIASAKSMPEGVAYWDQIVASRYGNLYYAPNQLRNGTLGWVTNHGEIRITVESGSGRVLEIEERYADKLSPHDHSAHLYTMGMEAYREFKNGSES